ncbi:synaptonemal complex protein 1 [Halichoeres trimaculatus]|uniref:synaptonemal complex protein 1 n=1 Tax=Halichoeres trimaculatus TaxID=147232 RepID=UPI003D9DC250
MERDRRFNFKLWVPPRLDKGQVSVTRPQETVENHVDIMNTVEQGYSKCSDKEQVMCFPSASMVAPTKPTRQDFPKMKAVPPTEKNEFNHNTGQLYSKLFDEVEKIKSWKVQADSDTVKKERRLQENKKTIETQRKAVQELQFENESLSMKLEEQISENEELRDKNNSTRTLCNILKDTFERSAEKMHLFESEREETHHLFVEKIGHIERLVKAFESLQIQVEADQQEMEKVKEGIQQFEVLKEKYNEEYNMKEQEVTALQNELKKKENELQKILLDFGETQKHCKQLEDTTGKQHELLQMSETERESLLQKLQSVEQCLKDTDKKCEAITAQLVKSKEEYAKMIQIKDLSLQELSTIKTQQKEKLERIQKTIQELQNSLSCETQRAKELEAKLSSNKEELEKKSKLLGETMKQSAEKDGQIHSLEDELDKRSLSNESFKIKIRVVEDRVKELEAELVKKNEVAQLLKVKVKELEQQLFSEMKKKEEQASEMDQLQKDFTLHEEKYKELLYNFNELQSEKKAIEKQLKSGSSNMKAIKASIKASEEKVMKLTKEIQRLEEENQSLREEVNTFKTEIQKKCQDTETLQQKTEEKCEHLQEEITEKQNKIKAVETKLSNLRKKFDLKLKANEEFQKENKALKKQIANEIAKSSELDITVQKLRLTTAEAIKNREDTELKYQHKIADMVSLMDKHKSQYDQIVEGKDAQLDEKKNREMEAVAQIKSLELDLLKNKEENDQLKQQLKIEVTEKANLQTELTDLKKEVSFMKITQLSETGNKQYSQRKCSDTLKQSFAKGYVFDLSKCRKTPCNSKAIIINDKESDVEFMRTPCGTTPKTQEIQTADLKTPQSVQKRTGGSSKIKSYRIRTPPSTGEAACWGKSTVELDPKSDGSDPCDLLTFVSAPTTSFPVQPSTRNIFKEIQSPVPRKSPGNSLKLAAMKRMRDAGWTAVSGCGKKKKDNEKIFA